MVKKIVQIVSSNGEVCNNQFTNMAEFRLIVYANGILNLYSIDESTKNSDYPEMEITKMSVGVWNHLVWHLSIKIEEKEFEFYMANPMCKFHYGSNYEL